MTPECVCVCVLQMMSVQRMGSCFFFFPPYNSFNVSCLTVEVLISNIWKKETSSHVWAHSCGFVTPRFLGSLKNVPFFFRLPVIHYWKSVCPCSCNRMIKQGFEIHLWPKSSSPAFEPSSLLWNFETFNHTLPVCFLSSPSVRRLMCSFISVVLLLSHKVSQQGWWG